MPLWAWVLVGWLAAGAGTAIWQRGDLERAVGDVDAVVESVDIDWDLDVMSARELRALPGIGKKRAVDLVEARWQHDPGEGDFDIESVDGIGQKTASAVHQFVRKRRSSSPLPPPPPRFERGLSRGPLSATMLRRSTGLGPKDDPNGAVVPRSRLPMPQPPIPQRR